MSEEMGMERWKIQEKKESKETITNRNKQEEMEKEKQAGSVL